MRTRNAFKITIAAIFAALCVLALASTAFGQAQTLKTDAKASSIQAVGAKVTGDHTLTFMNFQGKAVVDGDTAKSVAFTVQVREFTTDMDGTWGDKLADHLRSVDFFYAEAHPTATFESISITPDVTKFGTHTVKGDLTLRGKTVRISFPAKVSVGAKAVTGEAEFKINREAFDMAFKGRPDDLIKDDVLLKIKLNFKR